jgi:hypothetical protein
MLGLQASNEFEMKLGWTQVRFVLVGGEGEEPGPSKPSMSMTKQGYASTSFPLGQKFSSAQLSILRE